MNFPERAYIAPPDVAIADTDSNGGKFIPSFDWDVLHLRRFFHKICSNSWCGFHIIRTRKTFQVQVQAA